MDPLSQRSATPVSNWLPTPSPAPQSQQLYAGQGHGQQQQHQQHQHVLQYLQQQYLQQQNSQLPYVRGSQNNLPQLSQQVTQPPTIESDCVSMPPPLRPTAQLSARPRSTSTRASSTPSEGESWRGIPLNDREKLQLIQLCVANIQTYKLPNVSGCVRWWEDIANRLIAKKITTRPSYHSYSANNVVNKWVIDRKNKLAEERTGEEVEEIEPEHGDSLNNFDQALDCWIAKVAELEAEAAGKKESAEQLAERLAETERQRDNLRRSFSWKRKRAAITGSRGQSSTPSGRIVDLTVDEAATAADGPSEVASTSASVPASSTSDADDTSSGAQGQRRKGTRHEQQQALIAQRAEQAEKRLRLSDDMVTMMRQQHEIQREQMAIMRDMLTAVVSVVRPPPERPAEK